uniref:Uncharacterized protein n=1 Tax=Tanacetum cinerariifolium TaxID=118510 RepID=A0A699H0L9_TANCI|nr:hypothetical protein [Tanacetum cinerariifolium]
MDHQYPTVAKIPVLDIGKFEQWQFRIQQYLQHEHYALWEVIKFDDSYVVPANTTDTTSGDKSGRAVTLIAKDMQRKKNDVKARTTLLLSLPDEHQLQFSKQKKNLLKQQYGNFKAKGSETLEQTINRLQVIVGQLQFMDVEIEHDNLNQKFITSLALEWLMHTTVWRNRSDLDTMSLDDLYNHLKVCESEVQKKTKPNSQNMAFISSAKHSSRNKDGNTACVPTASTNVPTATASVATISQDIACAYIASQSSGSQIKFEDINQIDEDDMEEIDIKWNMALLSMRADKAPKSQNRGRRDNFRQGSKAEEQALKALMAIDRSQRSDKNKEGLGYTAVPPPPPAQLYLSSNKDLSWTGLSECADDTITNYSRPSPIVENKKETPKKPPVKYAKQYRKPNKKPNVRGNQRNWNNLKSHQLGPDFVMKKKACFNYGNFNHLASDCRKRVKQNLTPRLVAHRPYRPSQRLVRTNMNDARPNRTFFDKQAHSYTNRSVHRTLAVRTPYRAPWVPSVYRNYPPVNRKLSTGSRNFPTAKRKFPTASRKFPTGSTKSTTANIGMKGKAAKPLACWFWKPSQN